MDLASIVHAAVETSRPAVEAAGHPLTVSLPQPAVYLEADATRMAQVFANLLNNAAKFTEAGGRIWLTAELFGSTVVVRVRDTGIGIPPEMQPRVFDLFTQVDRSADRSRTGLGIGLTLVKALVEMHGGTVEAASEGRGRGSEFTVHLPTSSDEGTAGVVRDTGDRGVAPVSRRVLVVDDNRDAAESLAMLLRVLGHEVRAVYDGPAALAAAEQPLDVVLLDLGMPGMSGYEVARRLRVTAPAGAGAGSA